MNKETKIMAMLLVLALCAAAQADELLVPAEYPTIQAAIDDCNDGDTVIVADGTYTGPGNRDIDFRGKAITVRSESGPENCIIDCNGTETDPHRGFYFHNTEDATPVLDGFTIVNGYGPDETLEFDGHVFMLKVGGAIFCNSSSPAIINCTISDNFAQHGGAIFSWESNPTITNCEITGNSAGSSGGIDFVRSSPTITNCTITENEGGGIYCYRSSAVITDCIFTGNTAMTGGAINCYLSSLIIVNCTITSNKAWDGGGIWFAFSNMTITNSRITGNKARVGGAICCSSDSTATISNSTVTGNMSGRPPDFKDGGIYWSGESNLQIKNCILWDNGMEINASWEATVTVTYTDIQQSWQGQGNIDADPLFLDPGYWDVNDLWVDGDYHLLPDSPCVDTGDPNYVAEPSQTDLDGNPRARGYAIDMGAYETIIHEARLLILPRVINRKSSKPRIMAWVRLPQGITKDQIDADPALVLYPGGIKAIRQFVIPNRRRGSQRVSIFAVFDKAELMDAIPANGRVELQVLGRLRQPGQYFSGSDTIRIIPRPSKPQPQRKTDCFKASKIKPRGLELKKLPALFCD